MPSAAAERIPSAANSSMPPILRGDDDAARLVEAALSTDDRPTGHEGTGDLFEHEAMFERFLSILTIAVLHVVSCLVALAIGGLEGHWVLAVVYVTLATVAALMGVSVRRIGWRLGGVIFAVEFLTWVVLA